VLASYTDAIAGLLTAPVWDARCKAVELLALACSAVANIITDPDLFIGRLATGALHNLKLMRARLHWATARAFVQVSLVRPYALFWYEDVVVKLCAPGGVWAERERAAFEAEFI